MNTYAPIILFVYNRPEHTLKTLEALTVNKLADQSTLYIYADGPKANEGAENLTQIAEVRKVIRKKNWCKEVIIRESPTNKGLADSIIGGVTDIIDAHGRVIVLEDDLLISEYFLDYMNRGLEKYKDEDQVMQISGFSYPVKMTYQQEAYLMCLSTTWGWATWKRAWDKIDFECEDYVQLKQDKKLARQFNLDGIYNFTKMFIDQMETKDKISSWGIRFWWNVFKQQGLVLYPDHSLVKNIGWDSSGRHGDHYDLYPLKDWQTSYQISTFPEVIDASVEKTQLVRRHIKSQTSLKSKIISQFKNVFKNLIPN